MLQSQECLCSSGYEAYPGYNQIWDTKLRIKRTMNFCLVSGSRSAEQQCGRPGRPGDHRHSPGPGGEETGPAGQECRGESRGAAVARVQSSQARWLHQRRHQDHTEGLIVSYMLTSLTWNF